MACFRLIIADYAARRHMRCTPRYSCCYARAAAVLAASAPAALLPRHDSVCVDMRATLLLRVCRCRDAEEQNRIDA